MKTSTKAKKPAAAPPKGPREKPGACNEVRDTVPGGFQIRSILVPIDFSWPSKKALEYAIPFARQFGAKITLLFVAEPAAYPSDLGFVPPIMENDASVAAIKGKLKILGEQAMGPELLEKVLVRAGPGYVEITAAAKSLKADLIVIATHGYTGLKHILLGSTAERVVRHAPCPVLVVREAEHEFV